MYLNLLSRRICLEFFVGWISNVRSAVCTPWVKHVGPIKSIVLLVGKGQCESFVRSYSYVVRHDLNGKFNTLRWDSTWCLVGYWNHCHAQHRLKIFRLLVSAFQLSHCLTYYPEPYKNLLICVWLLKVFIWLFDNE